MNRCNMCPRKCNIIRSISIESGKGEGVCKMGILPVIARAELHYWEEPCISGQNGSGTVFFSGCNLKCVYCQNYKISNQNYGKQISINELIKIYSDLIDKGAYNINLVNPSHFIESIIKSLQFPLKVPVVYNSSGYDSIDSLKLLKNKIQIYLPDLKYYDSNIAYKYSKAKDYFEIATKAIIEMYNQVGNYEFDNNGILKKGVIIRHLILPNNIQNTFKIIDWVKNNFKSGNVLFSLMAQYTPYGNCSIYPEINRKITKREYNKVQQYLFESGIEDGYIQDFNTADEIYIPKFEY